MNTPIIPRRQAEVPVDDRAVWVRVDCERRVDRELAGPRVHLTAVERDWPEIFVVVVEIDDPLA